MKVIKKYKTTKKIIKRFKIRKTRIKYIFVIAQSKNVCFYKFYNAYLTNNIIFFQKVVSVLSRYKAKFTQKFLELD